MDLLKLPSTAELVAKYTGATVVGDGNLPVDSVAPLKTARPGALTFLSSKKLASCLDQLEGVVVFTSQELVRPGLPLTYLVVPHPQDAFSRVARQLKKSFSWPGVSDKAVICSDVVLGENVSIGPFAVLAEGARVGNGTKIGPFSYVGAGVVIGEACEISPRVTLLDGVCVGNRVKIFPGAVIGADGFGFYQSDETKKLTEMPQLGSVVLEDDVRIGANTTIDRATLGITRIGRGTKIDDQVHVAHNVDVGTDCVLCGQVGIAGSTTLEENVMLGGQAGVSDGVRIGKNANVGAQCGVTTNLKGGETYFLTPATPIELTAKIIRCTRKLPDIYERLKRLEERIGKEITNA